LVTRRWVDSGDFVASAAAAKTEPLFTVERDDRLRITFDIPESESSLIAVGQPVTLTVDALRGRTFTGRVQRSAGILDPRTRTLRVEAELGQPDPVLRAGMYGMVTVTLVDTAQAID
jgi:multidrug efflux pump subunit AcrA (membrane-fusion protein)